MGVSRDFEARLHGASLTTAEILYYMPDHPKLLQTFVWQTMDVAPRFPRMERFLDYWRREIQAVIHSVTLAADTGLGPARWRAVEGEFRLH
jgi:uncharacterized protein Usg